MPTPLEKAPDEVRLNFSLRKSIEGRKQASLDMTLLCEVPGFQTRPHQANHLCERVPRACAPCCKRLGGCKKHPLYASDLSGLTGPLVASQSGDTTSLTPLTSSPCVESSIPGPFACPLPADYGCAFVASHQARQKNAEDAAALQKAQEDLLKQVIIIFWDGVSDSPIVYHDWTEPSQIDSFVCSLDPSGPK
ncbi:hypothetical protein K439DRAFT_1622151 [Ramaria rubella]|nr:hypothetical protein K439DRAFT_1622151 [Ramaria rubella]